mmetsp:Transcript_53931/g.161403  ORF Transcript_53931/g.161403 Transcript_53931/m.161403 type:complete len:322 (+) Transcript_53931:720-1685(+)
MSRRGAWRLRHTPSGNPSRRAAASPAFRGGGGATGTAERRRRQTEGEGRIWSYRPYSAVARRVPWGATSRRGSCVPPPPLTATAAGPPLPRRPVHPRPLLPAQGGACPRRSPNLGARVNRRRRRSCPCGSWGRTSSSTARRARICATFRERTSGASRGARRGMGSDPAEVQRTSFTVSASEVEWGKGDGWTFRRCCNTRACLRGRASTRACTRTTPTARPTSFVTCENSSYCAPFPTILRPCGPSRPLPTLSPMTTSMLPGRRRTPCPPRRRPAQMAKVIVPAARRRLSGRSCPSPLPVLTWRSSVSGTTRTTARRGWRCD